MHSDINRHSQDKAAEVSSSLQKPSFDTLFEWVERKVLGTILANENSTIRRRIILLSIITFIGSSTLILFSLLAFFENALLLGSLDLFFAFGFMCNLLDARVRKKYQFNIVVGIILSSCLYIFLYVNGGVSNTAHLWYYTFPLIAFFLLGARKGAIAMLLMTLPVIFLLFTNIQHPFVTQYSRDFEVRFLFSYLLVGLFSYFFEKAGENNRQDILKINQNLETTVQGRTAELTQLNQQLLEEIRQNKLVQKQLEESEGRFRALVDLSVVGILQGSPEGVITDANRCMCEILDVERKHLVGLHISKLPFTSKSIAATPFRFDLLKIGKIVLNERSIIRPDGSEVAVEMRTIMMPDQSYQSIFTDITERNQFEQDIRESEERFRALHNASFGGIAMHDQGVILDCNHGLSQLTGFTNEELIGMDGIQLIEPGWRELTIENIQRGYEQPYEVEGIRKDGSTYPLAIQGSVIPYKGRTVRVTEFRDITEHKKAAKEKLILEEKLFQSQKMETVGQLAGGIAHDFNNMLGVIIGHSEMAMRKTDITESLLSDVKQIRKAAGRSVEITKQLLAFARKQAVEPKVLDLNSKVEGMMQMIRRLIGEDIELSWLPCDEVWPVKIDPSQMDQILINLCVNARDAMPGVGLLRVNTENCTLEKDFEADDNHPTTIEYVRLSVGDNGCGMEKETLNHAFEPFFTTKDIGQGTGLGLATVYGIVKQNGGHINVLSKIGQGTTIDIYIPRHVGVLGHTQPDKNSGPIVGGAETILLVEDELTFLEMTRKMLETQGYNVVAIDSPLKAIEFAEKSVVEINLLFTDIIMPEMNGHDLAKRIQKIHPEMKCLYMSGYTSDIIANEEMIGNDVELIHKPFSEKELSRKIRKIIVSQQRISRSTSVHQ